MSKPRRREQRKNKDSTQSKAGGSLPYMAEPDDATTDDVEADVVAVIEAWGGEREAVRALLIANNHLAAELERAERSVSLGFAR